ncbi:MAG: transcription antitermination factor NusB [Eubacteriales bacterium]
MEDSRKTVDSRKAAREFTVGLLFAKSFAPEEDADTFFARELDNSEAALGLFSDYVRGAFFGVCDNLADIDEKISTAAAGWSLSRISRASLAIMRLAVYEMTSVDDVPKRVALNEAIELAKKFDDDKAPSFVNGVLNSIAHSLPDRECDRK